MDTQYNIFHPLHSSITSMVSIVSIPEQRLIGDCGIAYSLIMTQLECLLAELNHDGERGHNAILQKQSFDSLMSCIDSADAVIVH